MGSSKINEFDVFTEWGSQLDLCEPGSQGHRRYGRIDWQGLTTQGLVGHGKD